jgi:hypothetical protein
MSTAMITTRLRFRRQSVIVVRSGLVYVHWPARCGGYRVTLCPDGWYVATVFVETPTGGCWEAVDPRSSARGCLGQAVRHRTKRVAIAACQDHWRRTRTTSRETLIATDRH